MDEQNYMDVKMVSDYLHIAQSTIYKWASCGYIPHVKLGTRTIFIKAHIDQWIISGAAFIQEVPETPNFLN